ncbi:glycoside hydrolase family 5 protein [uncultured Chitinophaga sp.]|jgi:Endoglucanase|uniref:glycoside hydrolase family 5 protein n=1 Tax=uncultured Chitinophaga sp. TaxID=339340 RepID=UPI00261AB4EC|nr:glycoside hydrolase family 5 protein [uncultured Chitinophaga sp.]
MIRRKAILYFAVFLLAITAVVPQGLLAQENNGQPASFRLKRGTNISHWLSQSTRRGKDRAAFFTEKDVKAIASHGFDHIRIPVDEEQLWNEKNQPVKEGFQLLHDALQWCYLHRLSAVVDLHILRSHHFNAREKPLWTKPEAQERFLQCWRELSAELKRYPVTMLAYELMNEPVADSAEQWNELLARGIQVIREKEPERVIIIGSNKWQSVNTFAALKVPEHDKHIMLSFHYYNPFYLTHHMASWTKIRDYDGPVHYPGPTITQKELDALPASIRNLLPGSDQPYNTALMEAQMQPAIQLAKKLQLPLYCGEWGCLNTVPRKDRLRWYKDVRKVLEKNGIAWSNWNYKSKGFGFVGDDGELDKGLLKALVK